MSATLATTLGRRTCGAPYQWGPIHAPDEADRNLARACQQDYSCRTSHDPNGLSVHERCVESPRCGPRNGAAQRSGRGGEGPARLAADADPIARPGLASGPRPHAGDPRPRRRRSDDPRPGFGGDPDIANPGRPGDPVGRGARGTPRSGSVGARCGLPARRSPGARRARRRPLRIHPLAPSADRRAGPTPPGDPPRSNRRRRSGKT